MLTNATLKYFFLSWTAEICWFMLLLTTKIKSITVSPQIYILWEHLNSQVSHLNELIQCVSLWYFFLSKLTRNGHSWTISFLHELLQYVFIFCLEVKLPSQFSHLNVFFLHKYVHGTFWIITILTNFTFEWFFPSWTVSTCTFIFFKVSIKMNYATDHSMESWREEVFFFWSDAKIALARKVWGTFLEKNWPISYNCSWQHCMKSEKKPKESHFHALSCFEGATKACQRPVGGYV